MGLQSDFFALNEDEFSRVLRGWKHPNPPLDTAREMYGTNPFTGDPISILTRADPVQPEADEDAVRVPALGKRREVVSWKWITEFQIVEIGAAFGVWPTVE